MVTIKEILKERATNPRALLEKEVNGCKNFDNLYEFLHSYDFAPQAVSREENAPNKK